MSDGLIRISTNAQQVAAELGRHGRSILPLMRDPIRRGALKGESLFKKYPPPRSPMVGTAYSPVRFTTRAGSSVDFMARRQSYERTGDLGREWTTGQLQESATQVSIEIGNNIEYAQYVQSEEHQQWYHAETGWITDRRVLEQITPEITAEIESALHRALNRA